MLAAALRSICAQTSAACEILVVDNGSTDSSPRVAREAGARVLQLNRNCGFSFAVNRGIEAATGDRIAIVNNDVELDPRWSERSLCAMDQSGAWFATGKVLSYQQRDRIDGAGDALCRGGTAWRLGHGRPDTGLFDTPRSIFFPSATALLARRELFDRTGPLDEALFAYLEDVDLGLRAALLGLNGMYVPDAVAYHRGSATLGAWSARQVEWQTRNQVLLLAKYYPAALLLRFWRPILAAHGLWAVLALRHGRVFAYMKGLASGVARAGAVRRASSAWRKNGNRLAQILTHSEAELVRLQRATGWDRYWWWYYHLSPRLEERSS